MCMTINKFDNIELELSALRCYSRKSCISMNERQAFETYTIEEKR